MQPLPLHNERTIKLQDFAIMLHEGFYEGYDITLNSFNFSLGSVSNSSSGFRYRKNSNTGILTSVTETTILSEKRYNKKVCIETKIQNVKEFEQKVFEILNYYADKEPEMCSAVSIFKLKCRYNGPAGEEILNIIEETCYPKWYEPLTDYLDSFFEECAL